MLAKVSAWRDVRADGKKHRREGRSGHKGRGGDGGKSAVMRVGRGGCFVLVQIKSRRQIHEIGDWGIQKCKARGGIGMCKWNCATVPRAWKEIRIPIAGESHYLSASR